MKKLAKVGIVIAAACATLALTATSAMAGSVRQDAYAPALTGTVTISPGSSGCVGEALTLSGSGAPANEHITVMLLAPGHYFALLGETTTGSTGNWSVSSTVPSLLSNGITKKDITPGDYVIEATTSQAAGYVADSNFSVTAGCSTPTTLTDTPAPQQPATATPVTAGQLPNTGSRLATVAILGALLTSLALAGRRYLRKASR